MLKLLIAHTCVSGRNSRFNTNPAEGGNNAFKTITRGLWNNFVKRGLLMDQMVEGDYVWYIAVWNQVFLSLRGNIKAFGGPKFTNYLLSGDTLDLKDVVLHSKTADAMTGLTEGDWECQLDEYIRDVCEGAMNHELPTACHINIAALQVAVSVSLTTRVILERQSKQMPMSSAHQKCSNHPMH